MLLPPYTQTQKSGNVRDSVLSTTFDRYQNELHSPKIEGVVGGIAKHNFFLERTVLLSNRQLTRCQYPMIGSFLCHCSHVECGLGLWLRRLRYQPGASSLFLALCHCSSFRLARDGMIVMDGTKCSSKELTVNRMKLCAHRLSNPFSFIRHSHAFIRRPKIQ